MPRVIGKNGEKTDFSDEIFEMQRLIQTHLACMGWSVRQFADRYCYDNNNYEIGDTDHTNCIEKIKKQLTLKCKTQKILGELNKFINYIEESEEFEKLNKIRLKSITHGILDEELENKMKLISIFIDKNIVEKSHLDVGKSYIKLAKKI
ncbi:hypothetical protein [Desulfomicrobium baculatum]|uniref:Uncharacterized protein n=1 Tax=Desulfomicrobium baculatum (strain DSM 4028 / VKM B-1378 / X) TaxID=525897 RepID=C7LS28_DESBD|nr:hypothetical protein [Desulfomicrobium baculatum]ACU89411.1 hypothetical protein Dbac_1312 [Desulfomicrobium baculatum DSM 4028]